MARTADQLTASEEVMVGELNAISNNSVIYKNNSGVYSAVSLGASGKVLQSNGAASAPTFETPAGSGASTALDNLASVAINTSLVSDTDNTDDLGTTLKKWANLFVTTIGATATRVTKGWFTDIESTNIPTVGGTAILSSLTAPQFTTIELGHASDTTISRVSAGKIAVEGVTLLDTTNISDTAYGAGWNGDTTNAPSKNAVYDKIETLAFAPKEIRIRIPGELIADTSNYQGVFWRNNTGASITVSNVAFAVAIAAAGSGAAAAFNVYKSSGTAADGINTNAVNLFTSAVDLTTTNLSATNSPNTATVEDGRWVSLRVTSSAGATNKASDAEVIITYS